MMRILVFGGTGFLGKNLVEYLLREGYEVGMYVRPKTAKSKFVQNHKDQVNIHIGEFQYDNDFDSIIKQYDVIFHLISSTVPGLINPLKDIETTIKPSLRLLDAAVRQNIKRVIFFSSGGTVYGVPEHIPLREKDSGQPISAYGIQKQTIERYLRFYQYSFGLPVTILRISNPYGRYQRAFSNQGLIANLLGRYLTGQPVEIWGDGQIVRDYIYVDDVMRAAVAALRYSGKKTVFNIGSGIGYSINEIVNAIELRVEKKLTIIHYPGRKVDVPTNVLDITRAANEFSWKPAVGLDEGIRKMLGFWNGEEKNFEGKQ